MPGRHEGAVPARQDRASGGGGCAGANPILAASRRQPSTGAPHLLVDSTGTKAMSEREWSSRKPSASRPRQWCKLHLGSDAKTLEQIPAEECIGTVTAGGATTRGPATPPLLPAKPRP